MGKVTSIKMPEGFWCSTSTAMQCDLEDVPEAYLKFV